jgi:membrane protein DedA with SNARE-associated domain
VDIEDLKKTEAWFTKRGELTIFISRLVPVVRHIISLVAGIGKMSVKKFLLYTIIGATIWNSFLVYLGYVLGQHWHEVTQYTEEIDISIVILLIIGCVYFIYRHLIRRRKNQKKTTFL